MIQSKLSLKKFFIIPFLVFCFLNVGSSLLAEEIYDLTKELPEGIGRELVIGNCTVCHSESIILQNHMDRKGWDETIDWMQKEQGMWELDKNDRNIILSYLSKYQGIAGGKGTQQISKRKNRMYEFEYRPNPF